MARQSLIKKNLAQHRLLIKNRRRRAQLKNQLKTSSNPLEILKKLQKLSKSGSRFKKRCFVTGNPRHIDAFTGLSRHSFREFAKDGHLPGITKSSW